MLGAVVVLHGSDGTEPASIERASDVLKTLCSHVLVFGGAEQSHPAHRPLRRDAGELAAVCAALREAGAGHVAILVADLRHPSSELLRYMAQVRGSFDAIVPECPDGCLQPLLALYHPSLLRRAEGLLAAGERDLAPLLEMVTIRRITTDEVAKFGDPGKLLARARPGTH
ncbi:MAG: hypothetical protein ACOX9R_15095 [Armatimonadota bacterium]